MTKQIKTKKTSKQFKRDLRTVLESIEEDIDKVMAAAGRIRLTVKHC